MPQNKRTHWASTHCGPHLVRIFKNGEDKFTDSYDGVTWPSRDINLPHEIDIAEHIFANPAKFNETLIHEFVHVLEEIYRKAPEMFSTKSVGDCTALAKTIGSGIGEMLTRLEQVPQKRRKRA